MTTSAPSNSAHQLPREHPSHATVRQGELDDVFRLRTTTSWPSLVKLRASIWPIRPEPPGIIIFMAYSNIGYNGLPPQCHPCVDEWHRPEHHVGRLATNIN